MCLHLNLNTKLIDVDGVLNKRVIIFEDALLYLKQILSVLVIIGYITKNDRIASLFLKTTTNIDPY